MEETLTDEPLESGLEVIDDEEDAGLGDSAKKGTTGIIDPGQDTERYAPRQIEIERTYSGMSR